MAQRKPQPLPANSALFSDQEIEAIKKEAAAKVLADEKKQLKEVLLKEFIKQERSKTDPNEEVFETTIDLPGFAHFIMIDGVQYQQGESYTFARKQYDTVRDIVARAWDHEKSIGNANANAYRQPKHASVGAHTHINLGQHFLRV